jgi:hypothetical protein
LSLSTTFSHLPDQIAASHESPLIILPSVVGIFLGSKTTQSVVQIESGLTVTGLASSTAGLHVAAFNTHLAGTAFENAIFSHHVYCNNLAAMRVISATTYSEDHGNQFVDTENLIVKEAHIGGHLEANHFTATLDQLNQAGTTHAESSTIQGSQVQLTGEFRANQGGLQADHLSTTPGANVQLSHTALAIKESHLGGQVALEGVVGHIDQLQKDPQAMLYVNDSQLTIGKSILPGHAYFHHAQINSDQLITGDPLQHLVPANANEMEPATSGLVITASQLTGAQLQLRDTCIQDSAVKAKEALTVAGHTTAERSSMETNQLTCEQGKTTVVSSQIKAHHIEQQDNNTLNIQASSVEAEQTHLAGQGLIQDSSVKSDTFTTAGQCEIKHSNLEINQLACATGQTTVLDSQVKAHHIEQQDNNTLNIQASSVEAEQTHLAGQGLIQDSSVKSDTFTTAGQCEIKHSNLEINQLACATGQTTVVESQVKAHHIEQQTSHTLNVQASAIYADQAHLAGCSTLADALWKGQLMLGGQSDISRSVLETNPLTNATGQDSWPAITFLKGSHTSLTDTHLKGTYIEQQVGADLATNNVFLDGKQINLQGSTQVEHTLVIEAEQQITLAETGGLQGGVGSQVALASPTIDKKGNLAVEKASLKAHFSSQAVNALLADGRTHTQALSIETDQAVAIDCAITAAEKVSLVASSIQSNAEQHLSDLYLQSTQGLLEVTQPIDAGNITMVSAGKAVIHDSLLSRDKLAIYGEQGIEVTQKPFAQPFRTWSWYPARMNSASPPTSLLGRHYNQRAPYSAKSLGGLVGHAHPVAPSLPAKLTLAAQAVTLVSGQGIVLQGADILATHVGLAAKGDILFDINHSQPAFRDYPSFASLNQTRIMASDATIQARNLINNGQTLLANTVDIQLAHDLCNLNQGCIAASQFLSIEASNIYNTCQVETVKGEYGDYLAYRPSLLIGGNGVQTNGVGLYIHTTGKVFQDASQIQSYGSNVILADGGIDCRAETSTHTTYQKDESHLLGLKKTHVERIETDVAGSSIISQGGKNILVSTQGGLNGVALSIVSSAGNDIQTAGNIVLVDQVTQIEEYRRKQSGPFYSKEHRIDEVATPSNVLSEGAIRMVSQADIALRGVNIVTPEQLQIKAQNLYDGVSKLNHSYESSSFGMNLTLCNQPLAASNYPCQERFPLITGGSLVNDATQLAHSQGAAEALLNTWSTGVDVANAANGCLQALRTGNWMLEPIKQVAPMLYAPELTLNLTKTKSRGYSQSLGEGAIIAGAADIEVENLFQSEGVPIQVAQDLSIQAKQWIAKGVELASGESGHTQSASFSVSAQGDPYRVGGSLSEYHCTATTQASEYIQVGGTLTLHLKDFVQDNTRLDVGKIKGEIENYTLMTRTDTCQRSGYSVGVDTGGGFCLSKQQSSSQLANQVATLTVHDSIDSNEFIVHHLVSEGGSIQSGGVNGLKPDTIEARSVAEYQESNSFSISGNYKNYLTPDTQVNHLLPPNCQSRQITTTDVYINQQDYRAHTDTVIYGAQGTAVNAHQAVGTIHTASPDGAVVEKNTSHHYHVAIPHMDGPTQQQFKDNKDFLLDKLRPAPAPVATPPPPSQAPGKGESKVPTAVEKPRPATGYNKENGLQGGSSSLEPWQASVVAGFDAGLGIDGKASSASSDQGDPLAQEVTFIYEHSQAASSSHDAPKTTASHQGQTKDSLAYVYSAPKSFDEQARDYFQEQMVGFYGDYQSDGRRKESRLDLTVPEHPPKNRAAHYQNTVSQPKDWQSSLARWERAVVDDFDSTIESSSPFLGNKLETNDRLTPIPIYQLPEFRREPTKSNPPPDLMGNTKQGINHLVDDILEIDAGVQRGMIAGFTFNPVDTSTMNSLQKTGYYVGEGFGVIGGLMTGEAVGLIKATQKYSAQFFNVVKAVEAKSAGAGYLSSELGLFGAREIESIGLTSRLSRTQIKDYLSNVHTIPREQLIRDLESVGFRLKGESPSGLFKTFEDKAGNLRIKIHPPDPSTDYSHIHIYDKAGNSLTQNLTRAPYDSSDVHIRIEAIQKELEWRLK